MEMSENGRSGTIPCFRDQTQDTTPMSGSMNEHRVIAVLGLQWGDEGKGKLVDILARNSDVCARFNGGSNAGHTLVVEGKKYAFHLLPCGILHEKCRNILGNGVVVHLRTLFAEICQLKDTHPHSLTRLFISNRAHLLFDFHQIVDGLEEDSKKGTKTDLGTTKKGVGPCYSTKAFRSGVRAQDLLDWDYFVSRYEKCLEDCRRRFDFEYDATEELQRFKEYQLVFRDCIVDTVPLLHSALREGQRLLIEGANALMLDLDFGTYPYVTSSSTGVGGIFTGLGIPPRALAHTIGVVKAYTTRVGLGPFPTENTGDVGRHLQEKGGEFGTTTGRARRCGWLDMCVVRYSSSINGCDALNITKLDVLGGLSELRIGVAYKLKGVVLPEGSFPASLCDLEIVDVVYETLPGWTEDISHCRTLKELPVNAQAYLARVAALAKIPVQWVGVGPDRENTIQCDVR